jgi:peptidoglycan/xylan/chitin deacetylase (PgdA/CDA1 family)
MRAVVTLCGVTMLLAWTASAIADDCPGNPDALGTQRVIMVDPTEHPRIGTLQYPESLPLNDKEVVLSFDDGPVMLYTDRILETLAAECVKATFFIVGQQARAYPAEVRKVYNEGHTVATHSQTHPLIFTRLRRFGAEREIEQGITSVTAALGDPHAVAPFFRFPGLGRSRAVEAYLASRGIMVWSTDFLADDWTHISADEVMKRALERLERRGKGVLLLHDIQPATALMLPRLLRTLKSLGYHIVQVVPTGLARPKIVTEPENWVMHKAKPTVWPIVLNRSALTPPVPSLQSFGWPRPFQLQIVAPMPLPPSPVTGLVQASHGLEPHSMTGLRTMGPVALVETLAAVGKLNDEPLSRMAADQPNPPLVVGDMTMSSMIAPAAIQPKPRRAKPWTRRPAALAAARSHGATLPPLLP